MTKIIVSVLLVVLLLSGMASAMADQEYITVQARDIVLNRMTETLGFRGEDDAAYRLVDKYGNPLTDAVYTEIRAASGYPFFRVSAASEDGIHDEGLLDAQGNVIIPCEYADIEMISDRWQAAVKLTPSEADEKDYTFTSWSTNEKFFFRIESVDFYFDGAKVGTLNRSQYGSGYSSAYGAYVCVTNREQKRVFYNSRMEASPYETQYSGEYDSVYKNGKTTYYHQGTGQAAFTESCTLTPAEVSNPYLYDRGILYGLQGQQIFKPKQNYDSIRPFSNGYSRVSMNRYYGLIDESGNEVIPVEYDDIGYTDYPLYYGYISAVKDGKFGFLDAAGNVTCDFVYSSDIVNDRGTFATVKNLDGTIIVLSAAVGELAEHFADTSFSDYNGSMAFAAENAAGEKCLIDLYGNTLIPYSEDYRNIEVNRDGTVAVVSLGSRQYRIYQLNIEKPEPAAVPAVQPDDRSWTCVNGHSGNTGNFCTECGSPRPQEKTACAACGYEFTDGIPKFCPNCGTPQG